MHWPLGEPKLPARERANPAERFTMIVTGDDLRGSEDPMTDRYHTSLLLFAGILFLFVARTLLAARFPLPRMNDLFTAIALAGSLVIVFSRYDRITTLDWLIALGAGLFVGVTMYFATLFDPYDFWGIVRSKPGQALVRGGAVVIAMLGGLAVMHEGGP